MTSAVTHGPFLTLVYKLPEESGKLVDFIIVCVCARVLVFFSLFEKETAKGQIASEINIQVNRIYTTWHNWAMCQSTIQTRKMSNWLLFHLIGILILINSIPIQWYLRCGFLCGHIISAGSNCSVVSTYVFEYWKK